MKFFSTLALSVLGLATLSCAIPTPDPEAITDLELVQREAEAGNYDIEVRTTDNGLADITVTKRGEPGSSGSLIEKPDGTFVFVDKNGKELGLDELEKLSESELDTRSLEARGLPIKVIWKFAGVIKKYGPRVVNWLWCVGPLSAATCGDKFVNCAMKGNILPWNCPSGYICLGKNIKNFCKF